MILMADPPTNLVTGRCRRCSHENLSQARYCADCGLDLHVPQVEHGHHRRKVEGASGHYIRWIAVALIFLALLWLIGSR